MKNNRLGFMNPGLTLNWYWHGWKKRYHPGMIIQYQGTFNCRVLFYGVILIGHGFLWHVQEREEHMVKLLKMGRMWYGHPSNNRNPDMYWVYVYIYIRPCWRAVDHDPIWAIYPSFDHGMIIHGILGTTWGGHCSLSKVFNEIGAFNEVSNIICQRSHKGWRSQLPAWPANKVVPAPHDSPCSGTRPVPTSSRVLAMSEARFKVCILYYIYI